MRGEKRLWIYSGLAVPEGVGLVRRSVERAKSYCRVLLVGSGIAHGLVPTLSRLATDSQANLHVDVRVGKGLRDWAKQSWLQSHLSIFKPSVVFLVLDPGDLLARKIVEMRIRRAGAKDVWLVPHGIKPPASSKFVLAPKPHAAGFASWASRGWAVGQIKE